MSPGVLRLITSCWNVGWSAYVFLVSSSADNDPYDGSIYAHTNRHGSVATVECCRRNPKLQGPRSRRQQQGTEAACKQVAGSWPFLGITIGCRFILKWPSGGKPPSSFPRQIVLPSLTLIQHRTSMGLLQPNQLMLPGTSVSNRLGKDCSEYYPDVL